MAGDGGGSRRRAQCHDQQGDGDPAPVARSLPRPRLAEQGGGGDDDGISDALSAAGPTRATKRHRAVVETLAGAARYRALAAPRLLWLILRDGTYLTLPDGAKYDMPVDCFEEVDFCLSTGSLLFLVYCDRSCCLMNPSTGKATLQQISLDREDTNIMENYDRISKVVVSDQIVALLASDKVKIFARGPPRGARSCSPKVWVPPGSTHVIDIAIFQGKLYVLVAEYGCGYIQPPELHVLDTSHEQAGVGSVQCILATPRDCVEPPDHQLAIFFYLVPSGHRLLLVERQIDVELSSDPFIVRPIRSRFEVSEAVDLIGSGSPGHWSKVDTLMGRALFVSLGCSVSLPAQRGAREDCVYCMTERKWPIPEEQERRPEDDLFDCVMYNMRDKTVARMSLETAATEATHGGIWHPTWLFPANV